MNIYLLSQNVNEGYDTYDSCVVVAESEQDARTISPIDYLDVIWENGIWMSRWDETSKWNPLDDGGWVHYSDIDKIEVKFLGIASPLLERGVICSSFNAG